MKSNKKIKLCFCFVVDEIDYSPGFRPICFDYIKSSIEKYLGNIFDFTYCENNPVNNADIYLISSLSPNWSSALNIINDLRINNPNSKIIVGGQHITQLPLLLPAEADYGIRGEAEVSLPSLLDLIIKDEKDINLYKKIDGIALREEGSIFYNEPKRLNFEMIPAPDRLAENGINKKPYLLTSRGCPYKCTFCSSSSYWNTVSMQSAESIADEIEFIAKNFKELESIDILDDLFIADKKRLIRLYEILKEKNLNNRFKLICNVRADLVDKDMIALLKKLNVVSCGFGFEHGTDRILKLLKPQGNCSVKTNIKAARMLSKAGIAVAIGLVFGTPSETEQEVVQTCKLALKLLKEGIVSSVLFNILMPMPGTYYWKVAQQEGLVTESNDFEWKRLSCFADYSVSKFKNWDEWIQERRKRKSIYMNEKHLPQEQLYKILSKYDKERLEIQEKRAKSGIHKILKEISLNFKLLRYMILSAFSKKYKQKFETLFVSRIFNDRPELKNINRSKLADKYLLYLKGIEIGGSSHNQFGLNTLNVDYTDDVNTVFKQDEIKLFGESLKVDVVSRGDELPFKNNQWDFVISSHVIEHFFDPIKAIKEWLRVTKPGGYIFMIVPHKERTFDKDRERTTLQELIDRHSGKIPVPEVDLHEHYSVWITEDLLELCKYLGLDVVDYQNVDDKVGNGFTIVIRKKCTFLQLVSFKFQKFISVLNFKKG